MRRSALVIVNPASGGGQTGRDWSGHERTIRAAGLDCDCVLTQSPGQATGLARDAVREGRPLVVAAGGDGTMNEVVNGFFDGRERIASPTRFGILPLGTGGDFRRSAGVPTRLRAAASALAAALRDGVYRPLDLGRVTYATDSGRELRHFLNVSDAGIGGEVASLVNRGPRLPHGSLTFLVASLRALASWRNVPMRIDLDGEPRREVCQQVVVANAQYYGGGMRIAPLASWSDGLFDVVIVGDVGLKVNLLGLRRIRRGTHLQGLSPKISWLRARRVDIDSPSPVRIDVDGEQLGRLPATFEILPSALELAGSRPEAESGAGPEAAAAAPPAHGAR